MNGKLCVLDLFKHQNHHPSWKNFSYWKQQQQQKNLIYVLILEMRYQCQFTLSCVITFLNIDYQRNIKLSITKKCNLITSSAIYPGCLSSPLLPLLQ
ncbi:hypothetical protein DERP_010663 [Dermatophagoides pteronyssinus]|uniref:Uncharacterized protein n=1 Tax=Dermatophagoides pteronyssinus TaxID=6956 RepID=A0ABQ8JA35_DERPT|nr:hypothetical protein DERP_010663 [Dermatophagoides pteronyssinus]